MPISKCIKDYYSEANYIDAKDNNNKLLPLPRDTDNTNITNPSTDVTISRDEYPKISM